MSLRTADFFDRAVRASEEVVNKVGDRIYIPARPTVDENEDKIPYIIIMPGAVTNTSYTKDDEPEGHEDNANVSILCVAWNHDELMDLCEAVRSACVEHYKHGEDAQAPIEWQFSASEESYDPNKPCNFLTLNYQCVTIN